MQSALGLQSDWAQLQHPVACPVPAALRREQRSQGRSVLGIARCELAGRHAARATLYGCSGASGRSGLGIEQRAKHLSQLRLCLLRFALDFVERFKLDTTGRYDRCTWIRPGFEAVTCFTSSSSSKGVAFFATNPAERDQRSASSFATLGGTPPNQPPWQTRAASQHVALRCNRLHCAVATVLGNRMLQHSKAALLRSPPC